MRRTRAGGATQHDVIDAASEAVAKWQSDRIAADLEAKGFVRTDPAATYASQDELIAQLARDPDDLATYHVFADWLDERGDPWGRVMAVQTALAQLPKPTAATRRALAARRDELVRAEAQLLFQHAARLWGALGETIANPHTQTYAFESLRAEWFCGFVRGVTLDEPGLRNVRAFAELAIARLLRSITVVLADWEGRAERLLRDLAWPHLIALKFGMASHGADRPHGDVIAELLDAARVPLLRELAVDQSRDTDDICLALATPTAPPLLRRLALHGCELTDRGIAALERAPLALDELVLVGRGPYDAAERLHGKAASLRIALTQ